MAGALYVVATPIGNLSDLTLRAIDTLRAVHRVVAEDTRRTRALLTHLGITGKPVDRIDASASEADVARVAARLVEGESIALCTDAGTPVVSDPGTALVRAAARAGARVIPIPGPSAVMAALSVAGLCTGGFRFLGFLPRSGEARREAIALIRDTPETVVLFESPQRVAGTLADLAAPMPGREAVIARELTKLHEEITSGTLADLAAGAADRAWLGEVTLVLGPFAADADRDRATLGDEDLDRRIDGDLAAGLRAKDIADALAFETGRPRREIYARVIARRR
jgi:16S rRNA (cytidine1402-2'-O)-methyltransferase